MHELSICGAIADIATRHADGRPVRTIHVTVGQLRQVVPDTLIFCWTLVSADTSLDGSVLVVESVPARIRCRGCGEEHDLGDLPVMLCTACERSDVEVISGEELITSLDLAEV